MIEHPVAVYSQRPKDCGVVALANALQISYKDAKLKCFHAGWSSTNGIKSGFLENLCTQAGYEVQYRPDLSTGTVLQFTYKGLCLIQIKGHVMAAVNGIVNGLIDGCITEVHALRYIG